MKKFALIALSLAIALPASAQTLKLDSEDKPCLKNFSIQKGTVYQINAYIREADKLAQIYSDLHQNIQDRFNEAGIEIMSPHYMAMRDGNESTIPKDDLRPKTDK